MIAGLEKLRRVASKALEPCLARCPCDQCTANRKALEGVGMGLFKTMLWTLLAACVVGIFIMLFV